MNTSLNDIESISVEPLRCGFIPVEGGEIFYTLQGKGPLLCLMCTLSGTWAAQVKMLREQFTVLTYDMRGFGRSPSARGYPTNPEHAQDLAVILDALGFNRVILVGLSHGGIIAQYFALRFPQRLQALVLVATLAKAHGPTKLFLGMLRDFLQQQNGDAFWQVLRTFLISERNWDRVMSREKMLRRLMFNQFTVGCLENIYSGALQHDLLSRLGEISCPSLVVGGEEDMLFPAKLTREIAASIPSSRLALLPTAHVPPVEAPEEFNALLSRFCIEVAL